MSHMCICLIYRKEGIQLGLEEQHKTTSIASIQVFANNLNVREHPNCAEINQLHTKIGSSAVFSR